MAENLDPQSDNFENLASIKNFGDLLQANGGKVPSRKELLEMLDSSDMAEELKENLRNLLKGGTPELFGNYGSGTIIFVLIIFSIIFFFGYKLYKSIKAKELKKEEKKKLKQMKKKK